MILKSVSPDDGRVDRDPCRTKTDGAPGAHSLATFRETFWACDGQQKAGHISLTVHGGSVGRNRSPVPVLEYKGVGEHDPRHQGLTPECAGLQCRTGHDRRVAIGAKKKKQQKKKKKTQPQHTATT